MHTTTVRFTADQWAFIRAECERLGIAKSAYVREAVILYMGRQQAEGDRLAKLEAQYSALAGRIETLARMLTRVAERVTGGR